MRLIDADKLRQKDMNGDLVDIFDVLEAPIVEAIPIEWIKRFKKEVKDVTDSQAVIDWLIDEWEEENEIDRR